jgi:hypothetical protein
VPQSPVERAKGRKTREASAFEFGRSALASSFCITPLHGFVPARLTSLRWVQQSGFMTRIIPNALDALGVSPVRVIYVSVLSMTVLVKVICVQDGVSTNKPVNVSKSF